MSSSESRPPTWFERELQRKWRDAGIEDVYVPIQEAPLPWWNVLASLPLDEFQLGVNDSR